MTEESKKCSESPEVNSASDHVSGPPSAHDLDLAGLEQIVRGLGEPSYRAGQVYKWLYQKRAGSFAVMDNLPKLLRAKLESVLSCGKLPLSYLLESSRGDATKFGFRCRDGAIIESVLLFDDRRRTLCVSSQLGCGLGCVFCRTGELGFLRNLSQSEILGQIICANDYLWSKEGKVITNVVFMGMGEALSNFDAFRSSLDVIMSGNGFNLGGRKITVSTAGVIPSIVRLMEEGLTVGLAISLNAHANELRDELMPINRRYPIERLVATAGDYYRRTGRKVTFEYVVIHDRNDTLQAAQALGRLLRACPCKVNLIPLNPVAGELESPSDTSIDLFAERLRDQSLTVTVRASRGRDISGACGQLAGSSMPAN